ncbi:hypothetical protein SRS16CHR_03771 [Variovorax sp. SRS16]|uniref:toll/interleukin-1 receptor domain-containing protein n=1 Tax=Variovorax sp. SRS16 TaxID=282217 RepID=UPI001317A951|nr:toll/interleukin-1 receptor domain-containing protein [Variovorax sp. SRS16]VTU26002.1 hypothetical protein SRS16CHR_03771 [Variovorax sp. SRS16]
MARLVGRYPPPPAAAMGYPRIKCGFIFRISLTPCPYRTSVNNIEPPRSVFISYATPDKDRANEICGYLEGLGHRCWIAPRDIQPGRDYGEEIIRGIEDSRCLVLVLSAAANASRFVKREVERAVSKAKPIFPVRVEDVLPSPALEFHLASIQFLDAWKGVMKTHVEELSRAISEKTDSPVAPQPRPPVRPRWKQPAAVAGALGVVVVLVSLSAVLSRRPAPVSPVTPTPQASPTAQATSRADRPQSKQREPKAQALSCRPGEGATLRCDVAETGRIKVRSKAGEELVVEAGTGEASNRTSFKTSIRETFVPWPGPGATAELASAEGPWGPPQPLPNLVDRPTAAFIAAGAAGKPPLAYTIYRNDNWKFLFFAPPETADVEWTVDNKGFQRVEPMPWQQQMGGPFWIDSTDPKGMHLSLRWRKAGDEWSAPAEYSFDTGKSRGKVAASLADPAKQIACRRTPAKSTWTICKAAGSYALGEIFQALRWGLSDSSLADASAYDFDGLSARLLAAVPPRPNCDERQTSCVDSRNAAEGARRSLDYDLRNTKPTLVSWQRAGADYRSDFLVIDSTAAEVFFKTTPLGGGEATLVRIPVGTR